MSSPSPDMSDGSLDNKRLDAQESEEHWVAVSDLMAGLMMVFLLVAIVFMLIVQQERDRIRDMAKVYESLRSDLYADLEEEFGSDLDAWGAELNPDLSLRFYKTELLFDRGKAQLKPQFAQILDDFFPRYIKIISADKYRNDIVEVRIEGHTDFGWGDFDEDEAYIRNMALSQARTRTTLAYVLSSAKVAHIKPWLTSHLTANGLSSSKPITTEGGDEDGARSRRVEFRLRTDAESRIEAILREAIDDESRAGASL